MDEEEKGKPLKSTNWNKKHAEREFFFVGIKWCLICHLWLVWWNDNARSCLYNYIVIRFVCHSYRNNIKLLRMRDWQKKSSLCDVKLNYELAIYAYKLSTLTLDKNLNFASFFSCLTCHFHLRTHTLKHIDAVAHIFSFIYEKIKKNIFCAIFARAFVYMKC